MASSFQIKFDAYLDTKQIKAQIKALQSQTRKLNFQGTTTGSSKSSSGTVAGGISDVNKQMKTLGTTAKSTGQSFTSVIGKVAKFGAATAVISGVTTAIRSAAEAVTEFDSALTEMKKVSSYSDEQLASYTNELANLGSTVARTRTQMTEAATEFIKAGYSESDSKNLSQVAAMFQNVADSEVSAGDAASFITSQLKAFNMDASQASTVIDQINEVSNNFAVSSTDVSSALTKTSSAMATFGNSSAQTIGLVTSAVEIMPNQAGKVARAFRTMGANITKMASDAGELTFEVNGTTKSISLLDETTGDLKSTYSVFSDISKEWDNMSNAEKNALGLQVAGKNHLEVFQASLSNFSQAVAATETALSSAGSAARENERYMDSLNTMGRTSLTAGTPLESFLLNYNSDIIMAMGNAKGIVIRK